MRLYSYSYTLLNQRSNAPFYVILQLCFGALLGILFGTCLNFESGTGELEESLHLSAAAASGRHQRRIKIIGPTNGSAIWLECVVLVDQKVERLNKFLSAIQDTYAGGCNETIFFTNSKALQSKFADSSINIYVDDADWEPSNWKYYYRILELINGRQATAAANANDRWIAILGVQNYLVTANIRRLVQDGADSLILGNLGAVNSFLSYVFPFGQRDAFNLEAGVILSKQAISNIMGSSGKCNGWFTPRYAGKALLRCVREVGLEVWDPIDEDGHHLFVPINLKAQFSGWDGNKSVTGQLLSRCCSHNAVTFGQLNYQEIRLVHYAANNLRVFGI